MSTDPREIDELAWAIMLKNEEYGELDRIFAVNGVINDEYFNKLTPQQQEDVIKRLAIGIQTFNAALKDMIERQGWQSLPRVEVSGNDRE